MLGREVEGDAMFGLAQERLAGGLGGEHARLAFDAELALESAVAGNQTNDGLGEVDVEIVADNIPPGVRSSAAQQAAEKSREILLRPSVADHPLDLAGGDVSSNIAATALRP